MANGECIVASSEILENCTIKPRKVPAAKIQNTTANVIFHGCTFLQPPAASLTVLPRKTPEHNCRIRVSLPSETRLPKTGLNANRSCNGNNGPVSYSQLSCHCLVACVNAYTQLVEQATRAAFI